jgi:hypothetical protein
VFITVINTGNRNILLISALHNHDSSTRDLRKPDITICETTKGSADTVHKMLVKYQCARNCWCWPMVTFYSMLNVCSITAFVLCHGKINPEIVQMKFLNSLSLSPVSDHLNSHAVLSNMPLWKLDLGYLSDREGSWERIRTEKQ